MELAVNLGVIFVFFILVFLYAFLVGNTMGDKMGRNGKEDK